MKRLVKWISVSLLLLVGLVLIGPRTAEAARWRRHVRVATVYQHHYVAPPVVHVPPVRVYAPRVGVQVGPGVHVRAPGVQVHVGSRYPSYYGRSYYYGW